MHVVFWQSSGRAIQASAAFSRRGTRMPDIACPGVLSMRNKFDAELANGHCTNFQSDWCSKPEC